MTAALARRSSGMRLVLSTVPLPTGVAWTVTARASRSARAACRVEARERSDYPVEVLDVLGLALLTSSGVVVLLLGEALSRSFGFKVSTNLLDGRRRGPDAS